MVEIQPIRVELEREEDGRILASVPDLPGVMAYGAGADFSFLDLRRPAFDLTDRGVGGRESPGPVDAYLTTERGIYRPGETVHAIAMLRDRVGAAVTAPLTSETRGMIGTVL